jgi:hypothetical protein
VEDQPILLNAKEHAVGYLSRILNARVYEAAIETELQHAKNLSAVSVFAPYHCQYECNDEFFNVCPRCGEVSYFLMLTIISSCCGLNHEILLNSHFEHDST